MKERLLEEFDERFRLYDVKARFNKVMLFTTRTRAASLYQFILVAASFSFMNFYLKLKYCKSYLLYLDEAINAIKAPRIDLSQSCPR